MTEISPDSIWYEVAEQMCFTIINQIRDKSNFYEFFDTKISKTYTKAILLMEELKEAFIKKNPSVTDNNVNDNIKILKKISIKERPFSPTSPSTFEKGVYAEEDNNHSNKQDWSLITVIGH